MWSMDLHIHIPLDKKLLGAWESVLGNASPYTEATSIDSQLRIRGRVLTSPSYVSTKAA